MSHIEVFKNQRAWNYDQFVEQWIPNYGYFLRQIPSLLRHEEKNQLLVVGCGTGNEIASIVASNEPWEITGIDPSPEMIAQARKKLEGYSGIKLIEGTLDQLPQQKKYSAATLLLVLHFLKDDGTKLDLLVEIAKRLAPGAPLIVLDITGDRLQLARNLRILKTLLPKGVPEEEIHHRLQRIQKELYYVSEQRLIELFRKAGFEHPVRFFQTSIYMGWMVRKT